MKRRTLRITVLVVVVMLLAGSSGLAEELEATSFSSNGDFIQGWYWLRDQVLADKAWWEFEGIPEGSDDLLIEITALATDAADGQRDVAASFRLVYGFPGSGMMGGLFEFQDVELPNVSPGDDPVGYTCRGTVKIPRSTPGLASGHLTVFAERVSASGPHVAFNEASVTVRLADVPLGDQAGLRTSPPGAFESNGTLVGGSYWCRVDGEYLKWVWPPLAAAWNDVRDMAVNLILLVTNTYDGGSGYSARVQARIVLADGTLLDVVWAELLNPFLPQFGGNTEGVGYAAFASFSLPSADIPSLAQGFSIRIAWPPTGSTYHFAGNENSALLAWIEGEQ